MDRERLLALAKECGAGDAVLMSIDRLVLDPAHRKACEDNVCGLYGKRWNCPPACGDIGELMEKVRSYRWVLLYQNNTEVPSLQEHEAIRQAKRKHLDMGWRLQQALMAEGVEDTLPLSVGFCDLCESCTLPEGLPCRHPERVFLPMEACGIDVAKSLEGTSLHYWNGEHTVGFFGAVLLRRL